MLVVTSSKKTFLNVPSSKYAFFHIPKRILEMLSNPHLIGLAVSVFYLPHLPKHRKLFEGSYLPSKHTYLSFEWFEKTE